MTAIPESTSRRPRAQAGELRKLGIAAGIFVAAVGGYVGVERGLEAWEEAHAVLPDGAPSGPCTLWFLGSSTMYRWTTLSDDMKPWDVRRRGVNGAMIPQIVHRFEGEPAGSPPPAAIIWYAGENDIAAGASGAKAFAEFQAFMDAKTRRYRGLPVIALSLKPSPARWTNRREQTIYNDALRRYAAGRDDLGFVDMRPLLLVDGRPGPFYVADGIHMNAVGYARWARTLHTAFARLLPRRTIARCGAEEQAA